ncbi:hypothetical protein [uncultured Alsobacter sp.]|uniref:hypothetical protein n=1 Tax=uncultured Alsobacter sp. TaxID=1748258 RepID=UPI0025DC6A52|nr:hypothetical protein [uncultured Alsobacter sp.]
MSPSSPVRRHRPAKPPALIEGTVVETPPAAETPAAAEAGPAAASSGDADAARRRSAAFASRPDLRESGPPSWSARFNAFAVEFVRRHASTGVAVLLAVAAGTLAGRMLPQAAAPVASRPAPDLDVLRGTLASLDAKTATLAAAADVQALERRIASLREVVERGRTEATSGLSQLAARDPSSAIAQLSVQVGRMEDAVRDIGARLDAAEQRASLTPTTTGSIASRQSVSTPAQSDGATTVQAKTSERPVLTGWLVHDVRRGVALVEGPAGLLEIAKGQSVPGLGRVESIERRGRGWIVLTSRGVLEPAPW